MNFQRDEFRRKIAILEDSISRGLCDLPADEMLFTVRDLLLTQIRVCSLHYKLMELEQDGRILFADEVSSQIMDAHIELARFFQSLPKSEQKPTYEMESIMSLYAFTAHHLNLEDAKKNEG